MFDFIGHHKKLVQLILALITLPFPFFGVDYYFRSGSSSAEVARVGGDPITQAQFDDTIREQQDRMRQPRVAVKCVEMWRNTSGEADSLVCN